MFPSNGELECRQCQIKIPLDESKEIIVKERKNESRDILVIDDVQTLPKTKIGCPQCGHNEAYWVMRQMRGSDEPESRIYMCAKCNNKWRED